MNSTISTNKLTEKLLLGPGPSNISIDCRLALSKPTIGHLDPEFLAVMDNIKRDLQYCYQTENAFTFVVSGPGSLGMEFCFTNLIEPGDKVLICINGVFGSRMANICERLGAIVVKLDFEWGTPVSPEELRAQLKEHEDTKVVAFVHAETSTGVLSDAKILCKIAKEFGCLTVVDAVTSLAGSELQVDEWEIDAIYSGSQKCLSCIPGLSPVSLSTLALEKVQKRKSPIPSWFLDINLLTQYWGSDKNRSYHHTAPVNNMFAMHYALQHVVDEGLKSCIERHKKVSYYANEELTKIGLKLSISSEYRLPQLLVVDIPDTINDEAFRYYLLNKHQLEIGAGLGKFSGKVWRIGLMGENATYKTVDQLIDKLSLAMKQFK